MWRRLTACILIGALVLQGIAFTFAGTTFAVGAAGATGAADWAGAGFELCRHNAGAAPDGVPATPAADTHCIFCLAGATVLGAPATAPECYIIAIAITPLRFAAWRLPADTVDASTRARGPPPAA
jgi:hypothetical protein